MPRLPHASKPLTPKQAQFVEEYLIDLNATQAALRAGYRAHSADVQGPRILHYPNVAAAISAAMAERAKRNEITADMVLRELALIGFANMGDYLKHTPDGDPFMDLRDLTREQTAVLSEVTVEDFLDGRGPDAREVKRVKFKLCDKRAALVDIGKHLGMFVERAERRNVDKDGNDVAQGYGVLVVPSGVTADEWAEKSRKVHAEQEKPPV